MEPKQPRQLAALGGLLVVLAIVVAWQLGAWPTATSAPAPAPGVAAPQPRAASGARAAPDLLPIAVALAELERPRPALAQSNRNPFGAAAAPPPVVAPPPAPPLPSGGTDLTPQEPPPPPIALRFIGLLVKGGDQRVAVLSDGRFVYYGRDGDIIDGRYRLVSVADDGVEMEHLDGRGRQRIRLSGS